MILVQGEIRIHADDMAMMREASGPMIAATRDEDGCLLYAFAEDVLEPGLVRISERWRDGDAIAAHGKTAHMATFRAALGKARVLGARVVAYDGANERVLMGG